MIKVSSRIFLFIRLGHVLDYILKSFTLFKAFSTFIQTLAIVRVSIACCPVNLLAPFKNEGIVKKAFFLANKSLTVNPRSAIICCPGLRMSKNELFSTTNLSLLLPEILSIHS